MDTVGTDSSVVVVEVKKVVVVEMVEIITSVVVVE